MTAAPAIRPTPAGASQGTLDLQLELFPISFGMFASTTNRPGLSWIHVWYE